MPELGEIRKGKELGYKNIWKKYSWQACSLCGKERWVPLLRGKPQRCLCQNCGRGKRSGENHYLWKGGRFTGNGYIYVRLYPNDFFYPMANKMGYVAEHRLVVAKALGRCLLSWEVVHHKGNKYPLGSVENKSDNRYPENLELIKGEGRHNKRIERELKRLTKEIGILQQRVTLLEAENVQLKVQLQLIEA